jgi:KDO2-lipid IV(A) lauroyltransferase
MQRIGYYLILPFVYLLSLCPFWLLYGISDIAFLVIYYAIGYRKKDVYRNLKNSFPQKPEKEIKGIQRKYYRYLCDLTLETFKTLTMTKATALKRCFLSEETVALFNRYAEKEKSILIVLGHLGNWEWAGNAFSIQCKQQLYVIYHPLANVRFNQLIIKLRTRFGTKLIGMKETFRQMTRNKAEVSATAFIADQAPPPESAWWTTFLNQDTPVFKGVETMAIRFNYPVIFINVERIKRGYYMVKAAGQLDQPAKTKEGFVSAWHTKILEESIRKNPEIWLWSHRRWKHKKPA